LRWQQQLLEQARVGGSGHNELSTLFS